MSALGLLGAAVVVPATATILGSAGTQAVARAHPEIRVGGFPTGIALSSATGTVYVGNGSGGTLSLIDGNTCNARNDRGCRQNVTAATAGTDPIGVAVDESSDRIFVVNFSGSLAVVDGRTCNAARTSGCRRPPRTIGVGKAPQFLDVDERTKTVYVANTGSNTLSVIDARRLRVRATVRVGPQPFTVAVNDATGSVYVADLGAHTVSIVDGRTCNASTVSGCGRRPVAVNLGEVPGGIAINTRTDTVYVTGQRTTDVSVIDGRTCNARTTSGCRRKPVRVIAGAGARGIAVNEKTNTVYVANTADDTVSVIDGRTCNASVHSGCRRSVAFAPAGSSPRRVAIDEATDTVYVTNAGSDTVTMVNGRTCNGRVHTGCNR
jgi:YVTN family beta-propeller protein